MIIPIPIAIERPIVKEVRSAATWKRRAQPARSMAIQPPEAMPLDKLVRLAKMGWHIEQDYQQLKEELRPDHFEGRKWVGPEFS